MAGGSGSSKVGDRIQHFTVGEEKFRVGDTITLRPPTVNENPFIGRIHEVRKTNKSLKLYVSWFYRPEETMPKSKVTQMHVICRYVYDM